VVVPVPRRCTRCRSRIDRPLSGCPPLPRSSAGTGTTQRGTKTPPKALSGAQSGCLSEMRVYSQAQGLSSPLAVFSKTGTSVLVPHWVAWTEPASST
jgi:hypothetical protein